MFMMLQIISTCWDIYGFIQFKWNTASPHLYARQEKIELPLYIFCFLYTKQTELLMTKNHTLLKHKVWPSCEVKIYRPTFASFLFQKEHIILHVPNFPLNYQFKDTGLIQNVPLIIQGDHLRTAYTTYFKTPIQQKCLWVLSTKHVYLHLQGTVPILGAV